MFGKRFCGFVRGSVGHESSLVMGAFSYPFHSLVMLTSSEGSVYNLLPTTCTIGCKKTSFQDRRQRAENQPQSKSY